jgi:predicted DCC family thiol-disulfide oxidoreductase YuxK
MRNQPAKGCRFKLSFGFIINFHGFYIGAERQFANGRSSLIHRRLATVTLPMMKHGSPRVKVWFDSNCPLCTREIALMRKMDKRGAIRFIDIMSEGNMCPLPTADLLARLHAEENGKMLSGAAAFAAMWRAIPILRPIGILARSEWILAGLEAAYKVFLRVRPRLQRWMLWLEARGT